MPLASHVDHNEHSVQIVATEHGVADLRGRDPHERARLLVERCAAPEYRELLREYLALVRPGHEPISMRYAFAMHEAFLREGDMRKVNFSDPARV